jgi:signal transduction histidine kinase
VRPSGSTPEREAFVGAAVVGWTNALIWALLVSTVPVPWRSLGSADPHGLRDELVIGLVTFAGGALLVTLCLLVGLLRRLQAVQVPMTVLLSVALGIQRGLVVDAVVPVTEYSAAIRLISVLGYLVVVSPAVLVSHLIARRSAAQRARWASEERGRTALAEADAAQAALRREVAEHLHGTVQNRLVIVGAGLDRLAEDADAEGRPEQADSLRAWAAMVDQMREQDVRAISQKMFPAGLAIGLAQALALLLDRLPTTVATSFALGEGAREADQRLPLADRLAVASTVQEGLTNALLHGHATAVALRLEVTGDPAHPVLAAVLDDNGTGLPAQGLTLSGLLRHRGRLEPHGGTLSLEQRPEGGARLTVRIPAR